MNVELNGGPAFPFVEPNTPCNVATGMTLRDYFAAKAMQARITGYSSNSESHGWEPKDFAVDAYQMADAMLEARQS